MYSKGQFTILLDLQSFMGDFLRAGKSCIKIFTRVKSLESQMEYLNKAKGFFLKGLLLTHLVW